MTTEGPAAAGGVGASLRAIGATLIDMVGTRAELALVEFREEGERRKRMLVLALVAASFLAMGLLFAGVFVVALFWDSHRFAAIAAVTLVYLGVAAGAAARLAAIARASPPAFEATLRTLAADRELLRPGP